MRADASFSVQGLNVVLAQMTSMQGHGFQKAATRSLEKVMRVLVVPALKAAAPEGAPNRNTNVKRGRSGPVKRNITVKTARKRSGEFVAIKAGPWAFYAHFGIHGTKDHVIRVGMTHGMRTAQGQFTPDTNNVSSRGSRRANREGRVPALSVGGRFYSIVRVKGVKPNDWVTRAATGRASAALAMLAADTLPRKDGHGLQGGN